MLNFIVFVANSKELQCEANTGFHQPVEGAKLLHLSVLFNIGESTPDVRYISRSNEENWTCDDENSLIMNYNPAPEAFHRNYKIQQDPRVLSFTPSCSANDLTNKGMNQMYELGRRIKQHYSNNVPGFMPENANPNFLYIKSSNKKVSLKSAMAFAQGLYESTDYNEVLKIYSDSAKNKLIEPDSESCADIKNQKEAFIASSSYSELFDSYNSKYKNSLHENGIELTKENAYSVASSFLKYQCAKQNLPHLPDGFIVDSQDFVVKYLYKQNLFNNNPSVLSSSILREVFRIINHKLATETYHRITAVPLSPENFVSILSILDFSDETGPLPKSHIILEIWEVGKDIQARLLYNGQVLPVDSIIPNQQDLLSGLFPYNNFQSILKQKGYLSKCVIPGRTIW